MAGYGPPPIVPGSSTLQCIVKVQLNISCKNLLDKDVMSKSDPMTVISMFDSRSSSWLEVSHQFALNFNPANPYCVGLQGLQQAYCSSLQHVQLYGPTNISPVINSVSQFARQAAEQQIANNYFILLILTDGVITDMDQTKNAIVESSALPMSIIIVGVGGADFGMMEELDADDGLLRAQGKAALRDIVQFVPFRKFKNVSPAALAKEVLAEIPSQLTGYYKMRNILPMQSQGVPR